MSDIVVGAQIKVDAGNTAPTIKEVRDNIKQLKTELDNCTAGSEQHKAALEKLAAANKQINPTFTDQASTLSGITDHLKNTVPAFGSAAEGAKGFGATLKALMANPIVLIVAALVAGLKFLYDAFTSTSAGAKKMEEIFAGVSAAVKVVADRVMGVGRAIIDFFTGDFKGAAKEAKAAFSDVGEEITKAYNDAARGTVLLQQLKKRTREENLANAKADAEIAKLRESILDESIPIKQRIANSERVKEIDKKRSEEGIKTAKETLAAKILIWQNEFEYQKKHADELNELNIDIANKEKDAAVSLRATERSMKQLRKQDEAEQKAEEKEANDKEKEQRQKATEAEKARRENLRSYTEKLTKLQQEDELNSIRDANDKKLKEAEFAQAKEVEMIEEDFKQRKINRDQRNELLAENLKVYNSKIQKINDEHQKEELKKEKDFQKELAAIEDKANLDGITDSRKKERAVLDKALKDKTTQILENDKYTEAQRNKLILAYQTENRKAQEALTSKFEKEDEKKEKELTDKEIALKIKMNAKNYNLKRDELNLKQSAIDEQYKRELAAAEGNALKIREIELKHNEDYFALSEARKAISKAETDARLADADAVGNALGAISQLIGQQTVAGKGLSIAQALINTYTGATKALAQGGIAGIAGAAGVIAAGIASVSKIVSTQIPGQAGGGSPSVDTSVITPAPLAPQAQSTTTTLDQNSINSIGNATNRAFVLDADINKNKERQERLNRAARIG